MIDVTKTAAVAKLDAGEATTPKLTVPAAPAAGGVEASMLPENPTSMPPAAPPAVESATAPNDAAP